MVLRFIWYRQKRGGDLPSQVGDFPPKGKKSIELETVVVLAFSFVFITKKNTPKKQITWDDRYTELDDFKNDHGHVNLYQKVS